MSSSIDPANSSQTDKPQKPSMSGLLFEMVLCILVPTMILKKLSGAEQLGATWALVLALSFPLCWGLFEFIKHKKVKFVPALGFISILLTGGIGLMKLDAGYIAIKEAAIPFVIGLATLLSTKTRSPLVKMFLYNDTVLEVDKVAAALEQNQAQSNFNRIMRNATWMLAGSFFLSATLNYALAKFLVTSPSGTEEFNSQLGSMNLWSYPVIVLPCMVVMIYAMFYIFRNIKSLTGLPLEEIVRS
ncbi:MAG: VC0807 family protein [Arenicella sp.]